MSQPVVYLAPNDNKISNSSSEIARSSMKQRLKTVLFAMAAGFILLPWGIKNWSYIACLNRYSLGATEHPVVICNGGNYFIRD